MAHVERLPVTIVDLLLVSIILRQTAPYLPVKDLLSLASTSRQLRELIYTHPDAWRHLNLTRVKHAVVDATPVDKGGFTWRAERMDESLTEDEFYAGPLRGIFAHLHKSDVLKHVNTLVLDGLTVPADLVWEILTEARYNVRILSIREARQLNTSKLRHILRHIVRPTRPEGTPKLKALYIFGPKDASRAVISSAENYHDTMPLGVMGAQGAQIGASLNERSSRVLAPRLCENMWYTSSGKAIKQQASDWAETLLVCRGLIHFDAVLCRGPRHDITKVDSRDFLQPTIATVALGPDGCEACRSCPEGPAVFGDSPDCALPLLDPLYIHSSTLKAAICPERQDDGRFPKLTLRCLDCLRGRWCEQCNRFWCEDCYEEPKSRVHLRTEMQQLELRDELQREGWATVTNGPSNTPVKVFSKLCVEHCLVGEMMSGAGSNGMWG